MKALFSFVALIIGLGLAIANTSLPPPKVNVTSVSLANVDSIVQPTILSQLIATRLVFLENAYRVSEKQSNGILNRINRSNFTLNTYLVFRVGWQSKRLYYIDKLITTQANVSNMKADFKVGWQTKAHYCTLTS